MLFGERRPAPGEACPVFGEAMADQRAILMCSCEDTIPLDSQALHQGCRGGRLVTGHQFCRAELGRFRELVAAAGLESPFDGKALTNVVAAAERYLETHGLL